MSFLFPCHMSFFTLLQKTNIYVILTQGAKLYWSLFIKNPRSRCHHWYKVCDVTVSNKPSHHIFSRCATFQLSRLLVRVLAILCEKSSAKRTQLFAYNYAWLHHFPAIYTFVTKCHSAINLWYHSIRNRKNGNLHSQLTSIFWEQKPGVDLVPLNNLEAQAASLSMAE